MGEHKMSLKVERIEHSIVKTWSVKMGGELIGIVTMTAQTVERGYPVYRATYWRDGESITHPEVFSGEFANVQAVETIINNARV